MRTVGRSVPAGSGQTAGSRTASLQVEVRRDGVREAPVAGAPESAVDRWTSTTPRALALDVMFVIDATGSMGDEIEQLKANMVSIGGADRRAARRARRPLRARPSSATGATSS